MDLVEQSDVKDLEDDYIASATLLGPRHADAQRLLGFQLSGKSVKKTKNRVCRRAQTLDSRAPQIDNEGRLSFFMGNGLVAPFQYGILLLSPKALPSQKWIHVAVTVETSYGQSEPLTAAMYCDGELVDEDLWGEGTRQWSPEWPLRISRYDNTDRDVQYWDGKLDEVWRFNF